MGRKPDKLIKTPSPNIQTISVLESWISVKFTIYYLIVRCYGTRERLDVQVKDFYSSIKLICFSEIFIFSFLINFWVVG